MNLNYISKYNPLHQNFFSQGAVDKALVHSSSLSYPFYQQFSPVPLGSVSVSDDLPIIDFILKTSDDPLELFYAARKVGNFSLASEVSLNISDPTLRRLARSIALFLENRILEAREVLSTVNGIESEALHLWKAFILNYFDGSRYDGPKDLLIRNPLLYRENLRKCFFPELIAREHLCLPDLVKESPDEFSLVFFIYYENHCALVPDNDVPFLRDFIISNVQLVITTPTLLEAIANRVGLSTLLDYISDSKGMFPLTSELMHLLTREDSYFLRSLGGNSFATGSSIVIKPGRGGHYRSSLIRDTIVESVLLHRYTLRDRNTSDYGNRFYTSDLCFDDSPLLWLGEDFLDTMRSEYLQTIFNLLETAGVDCEPPQSYGCWFDASFTHGHSKIDPHFHTAGQSRSYLATAVLYLDVPKHQVGDGGIFFDNDSKNAIDPSSGDVVFFPPWLVHGTTPLNTNSLRITLNFDLLAPTVFCRIRDRKT